MSGTASEPAQLLLKPHHNPRECRGTSIVCVPALEIQYKHVIEEQGYHACLTWSGRGCVRASLVLAMRGVATHQGT